MTEPPELEARAAKDAAAIRRCQDGDLSAFKELVERYRGMAVRIAMGYLRRPDEALDASQDAFVRALEELPRFDPSRPFFPWFHAVLRNVCLNRLRRLGRRAEVPLEDAGDPAEAGRRAEAPDVRSALARLSPEHREVLVLRHWEELSYDRIAETLGVPVGTVMSRLHYARRALRRSLEGP